MLRRSLTLAAISLGFAALAVLPTRADVVTLANGRKLEGTVVGEDAESVRIDTGKGVQTIPRDDVVKVEKIADPKAEFARKKRLLDADRGATAKAWYDLGQWAADRKLAAEAKACYEKTIAIDPNHAGARSLLGYERVGGVWYTFAEAQKKKGLVEYEGQWVKPEEKERLEQGFVQEPDGSWVKKEVVEARKAEEAERERRAREAEKERARVAKEKERERAEREALAAGKRPPAPAGGGEGEDEGDGGSSKAAPVGPAVDGEPPSAEAIARQLEGQKQQARGVESALGLKFSDVEEGPLLVHTTHAKDAEKLRGFLKDLGKIYNAETKIYNLPFDAPIWPGKLQIYFFKDKPEFDAFATQCDDAAGAVQSGGYFIHGGGAGGDTKFHIAMFDLEVGTLAHELSHAFMARYQYSQRSVIPWVNEGVAEFLRTYIAETMDMGRKEYRHRGMVREMLARNDPRVDLRGLMAKEQIAGTEVWAYAVSYTAVDFMVSANKAGFVKFLKALKRGDGTFHDRWKGADVAEQTRALEESFGTPLDKFQAAWKDYIRAYK
ncbi:MAG TPA: hypothetical protein VHF22_10060 [Planctomycetota bacterium]|nr:hypothetical protein [Planctomycetota bacterium]